MIILASTSPRRKEILGKYFKEFKCVAPLIDESEYSYFGPSDYAYNLAKMKAYSVFRFYKKDLIIACDTIVVSGQRIFEKPHSYEEAFEMLKALSGKTHVVLSAYTILYKDFEITRTIKTYVTFNELTDENIKKYLEKNTYFDKAGGYAIQDGDASLVASIKGSYYNVVGFPIEDILKNLANLGYFPNKES